MTWWLTFLLDDNSYNKKVICIPLHLLIHSTLISFLSLSDVCLELPDPDLVIRFSFESTLFFFSVNQLVLSYYSYQKKKKINFLIYKVITVGVILPTY